MVFSSITFLFYFLPAALILCLLAPAAWRNAALLGVSLIFYAWGEPKAIWILLASLIIGYLAGRALAGRGGTTQGRILLAAALTLCIGLLGLFKYAGFFLEALRPVTGHSLPSLDLKLPIGISFYTFQLISYLIDVYRGSVPAQRRFIDLAAYIAMFPQLIAGPIIRYADIEHQLSHRQTSLPAAANGIRRFVLGLAKKVLLANTLGTLAETAIASRDPSVLFLWLYALAFTLQIYYDFSGYSDMAIGLGAILGFTFMENFNYPLTAGSITDFWRRWHISLGSWFRDYVYIPLGGSRVGGLCRIRNLFIVWGLTGLWHGAAWTYVFWGLYFALFLLIEKLMLSRLLETMGRFRHLYVLPVILVSFILFDAPDLSMALTRIRGLFGAGSLPLSSEAAWYQLKNYGLILLVAAVGSTPRPAAAYRILLKSRAEPWLRASEAPLLLGLFISITAFLVDGSFNPFLYFRF